MTCVIDHEAESIFHGMTDADLINYAENIYTGLDGRELANELVKRLRTCKRERFEDESKRIAENNVVKLKSKD